MEVSLTRPLISEEAIRDVGNVLRSGLLGTGRKTAEFENAFAGYVGSRFCVALNSCSAALHLAVRALRLPAGSEIITTPITSVSTNHAILYERCTPVFADVQPDTGNMDPASVALKVTDRTRAILMVHLAGYPCDIDELYRLARTRGLPVIEDCAHACGATYKGNRIGSHGELHAFSFQAGKNLSTGQGGALVIRDEKVDARVRRLRGLGMDGNGIDSEVTELGFRYQMSDIHAAIGLAQLNNLEHDNDRRAEIAAHYRKGLAGVAGVQLLRESDDRTSSNYLFCILVESRDALMRKLHSAGIETGVHFRRNDLYPMYRYDELLVNAERFWRSSLSLPLHLLLTDDQVDYVITQIRAGW